MIGKSSQTIAGRMPSPRSRGRTGGSTLWRRGTRPWIRLAGQWRPGRIITWVIDPGARLGWQCQIKAERGEDNPPWSGHYVYDPAAIRPRYGSQPPIPGAPYRPPGH
jgi:hypothetical protein